MASMDGSPKCFLGMLEQMPSKKSALARSMNLSEKMIQYLMRDGSRSRAQRILSTALEDVGRKLRGISPDDVLMTAISNATPVIEVKRRQVEGISYQVPVPVPPTRGLTAAIRSIVDTALKSKGGPMSSRLATALLASYRGEISRPDKPRRIARLSARQAYETR